MTRRKPHRILVAFKGSDQLVLVGTPKIPILRPLPDIEGLWVGEWDFDHELYRWHLATSFELATTGLIESYTPDEREARLAYYESKYGAFDVSDD